MKRLKTKEEARKWLEELQELEATVGVGVKGEKEKPVKEPKEEK